MEAADLNGDDVLTAMDTYILRKSLADNSISNGQWKFIEKEIVGPLSSFPKASVIGIKLGDIDDDAILQNEQAPETDDMFKVEDVLLNAGEYYTIPFYLENSYEVYGIDFRAKVDTNQFSIEQVYSDYFEVNNPSVNVSTEGLLSILIHDPISTESIGGDLSTPIFYMDIKAKENSLLSLALELDDEISYLADSDLSLIHVGTELDNTIGTNTNFEEIEGISIYPNPTSDYLNIKVSDEDQGKRLMFMLFDEMGRNVLTEKNNSFINLSKLNAGMYIYKIEIDSRIKVGRIILID